MKEIVKDENEKTEVIISKGITNTMLVLISMVFILLSVVVVGFIMCGNKIKELNEELVHTKDVLSEYGIYIDEKPQQEDTYDTSAYTIIKPSDIEKESKDKTIVLWIGRQSCGYCTMFEPYFRKAANNYGIKAYYIDLATMIEFNAPQAYITDEEQFGILSNLKGEGKWDGFASENVGGTPLTLIIKNNKVIGGLSGYADTDTVIKVFKDAGLKKN